MGWMRDALRELKAGRPAIVRPTGGPVQGRINRCDVITLSPVTAEVTLQIDDLVLARWKNNPMLVLVKQVRDGQVLLGDTIGGTFGWVPMDAVLGKVTDVQALPEGALPSERQVCVITFGIDTPADYGPDTILDAM